MRKYRPLTVLRLKKLWPHARKHGHEIGEIWRVGYYSKKDGLECVWLVNKEGRYDWTATPDWLDEKFEIITESKERSFYGDGRPVIQSIQK